MRARATPAQNAVSIMSTRRARSGPSGQADVFGGREGYRKASNWCPRARAMMLILLTGRPQSWLLRARAMMLATEAAGRGTKRDGTRAHACS